MFRVKIEIQEHDETYLTIQGSLHQEPYDAVLETLWSLLALLAFGAHKFDDAVIDRLLTRIQEFKS